MNAALKKRYLKQLADTDAAIEKITKAGQAVAFSGDAGSNQVTNANLKDLLLERDRLERLIYGTGLRARSAIGA